MDIYANLLSNVRLNRIHVHQQISFSLAANFTRFFPAVHHVFAGTVSQTSNLTVPAFIQR